MNSLPPVFIILIGAGLIVGAPRGARPVLAVGTPLVVLAQLLWVLEPGDGWSFEWLLLELEPLRVDRLSLVFGYVFGIAALLGGLYAWHLEDRTRQAAALAYAGTSLGVVFAGDLVTLVVFWELMAVSSAYLIFAGGFPQSRSAGMRYLFVHVVGGSVLLAGIVWHIGTGGSLEFTLFEGGTAAWLILGGFAINAAIPPLHAWLSDAYPEAGIGGMVFLSAFTTKTAVYVLARGFAGWEVLLIAGVIMAGYGILFALLENDIRRILAYEIISQVGYMVAAVGIGTELALNAAASHAFAHVIYKGLLLMGAGAVIYATAGHRRLTELGGIAGRMKTVVVLYMVGAFAISAFPLFSGFTTKSMTIYAAEVEHLPWAVFFLYAVSVGTFLVVGLKLPYFTWFGPRRDDIPVRPVPWTMVAAMAIAAALSIGLGVYPDALYDELPFPNSYEPYTADHVIRSLELLVFTAIGFWLLRGKLGGERTVTLDTDWFYRKATRPAYAVVQRPLEGAFAAGERATANLTAFVTRLGASPEAAWASVLGRTPLGRRYGVAEAAAWLGRPPTGVAVGAVLLTFIIVVLIAQAV